MNCAEANQIDLVEYLYVLGHQPQKIRNDDFWYLSPFREEKHASFKVNRKLNVWYDHGSGKGGRLVDFALQFYDCLIGEALQKISSFHQQKKLQNKVERQPFQRHDTKFETEGHTTETAIKIIAAKQPITDLLLCRYLHERKIAEGIANTYCSEVSYQLNHKIFTAIGFKNTSGGYELRSEYFKGIFPPKQVTFVDNNANNISVFEGFFDFLSYHIIHQNQEHQLSNFLVLNSFSFFEKSLLFNRETQTSSPVFRP